MLPVVQLLPEGTNDAACVARLSQLLVGGCPTALQAVWHGLGEFPAALRPLSLCSLCQGPTSSSVPP